MAVTNVYRNNPTDGAISFLQQRKSKYKSGPHYQAATTNPAYIKLTFTGDGGTVKIPEHKDTFNARQISSGLKTNPSLDDCSISLDSTEFGSKESISWTIVCYNREDFEKIEKTVCRYGSKVSANFGYARHWDTDQQSINIKDFIICSFGFNTTNEGNWVIKGKAVRATEALKKLETNAGIKATGIKYKSGAESFDVKGLTELMTYDAQNNGQKAIDDIDLSGVDGWVFNSFVQHSGKDDPGAVVVYKSGHRTIWSGGISKKIQGAKEYLGLATAVTSSVNTVYYTMQYVVSRMIMGQCHAYYKDTILDTDKFGPTNIKFDSKLSKSWIDPNILSGIPTQVVLAGSGKGNYKGPYGPQDELGINFENVGGAGLSPIKSVKSVGAAMEVDPSKILIERTMILNALEDASNREEANSDKTNDKSESEETINVLYFLRKLFQLIKESTGGSIVLGFTQHPEEPNVLLIVDQKNGKADEPIKCVVFNGIDGDGSTRSINLASRTGSPEMASAMMKGQTNQGDAVHNIGGHMGKISGKRASNYGKASSDKTALVDSPASLIKSRFDSIQESALTSVVNAFRINKPDSHTKQYDLPSYPGLELEVELDGVYGFRIGNAISSRHMSPDYFSNKAYFMVRSVNHTFSSSGSDWKTNISGILIYYSGIQYVYL